MPENRSPIFIRKAFPKDNVYGRYTEYIDKIEWLTRITSEDKKYSYDLDIAYILLPLVDTIAADLFNKSGRSYLRMLGYTRDEANIFYAMFRNGLLHNTHIRRIKYLDGSVGWILSSGGGSGPWRPFFEGEVDEETDECYFKPEKPFQYYKAVDGSYWASLSLDRLAMQIKFDIQTRKDLDQREMIDIVIGEEVNSFRPEAAPMEE